MQKQPPYLKFPAIALFLISMFKTNLSHGPSWMGPAVSLFTQTLWISIKQITGTQVWRRIHKNTSVKFQCRISHHYLKLINQMLLQIITLCIFSISFQLCFGNVVYVMNYIEDFYFTSDIFPLNSWFIAIFVIRLVFIEQFCSFSCIIGF